MVGYIIPPISSSNPLFLDIFICILKKSTNRIYRHTDHSINVLELHIGNGLYIVKCDLTKIFFLIKYNFYLPIHLPFDGYLFLHILMLDLMSLCYFFINIFNSINIKLCSKQLHLHAHF